MFLFLYSFDFRYIPKYIVAPGFIALVRTCSEVDLSIFLALFCAFADLLLLFNSMLLRGVFHIARVRGVAEVALLRGVFASDSILEVLDAGMVRVVCNSEGVLDTAMVRGVFDVSRARGVLAVALVRGVLVS